MKKLVLLCGAFALSFAGCASHEHRHARYPNDHYGNRTVVVEPGDRVYVREYDNHYHYGRDNDWSHRPYRGKHSDALGWNDPNWNR